MIESLRRLSLCVALCGFLVAATAVQAQTATYRFDLPAQPLADALRAVGRQTSKNILFDPALVEGISVPALRAELTVGDAIKQLLAGTKLSTHEIASDTVLIRNGTRDSAKKPVASKTTAIQGTNGYTRLAQAEAAHPETIKSAVRNEELDEVRVTIPEVLVVGSKTLNMDIRRSADDPQPYVIFDRASIEQSGATSVQDFLKTRLPMNATLGSPGQQTGGLVGDSSSINLRGLGVGQTLILVDGRRLSNVMQVSAPQQPDLNGIPLSAIERIEVLPSTASGIYGGGATGGVVNIVLKRSFQGLEVKTVYENSVHSDTTVRRVDLSGGFTLEAGRTQVFLAGSYSDKNPLALKDRDFSRRVYDTVLANNPAYLNSSGVQLPLGYTTNIRSANNSNLVLDNGTPLNSPFTHVPVGYAGASTDGGMAFVANAGRFNSEPARTPQGAFVISGGELSLYQTPTVESLIATVRRSFSPHFEGFLEVFGANNTSDTLRNFSLQTAVNIPADAPNNPFTTAIRAQVPDASANGRAVSRSYTRRGAAGVLMKLPRGWMAEADYTWSQSRLAWSSPSSTPAAITSAIASGAIDVLRDTNLFPNPSSSGWPPFNEVTPVPFRAVAGTATLRFAGPGGALPGGDISISGLLEHRDDRIRDGVRAARNPDGSLRFRYTPSKSQTIASAYLEALIPLVGASNRKPWAEELQLQLAARYDDYSTEGTNDDLTLVDGQPMTPVLRVTNKHGTASPTLALRYRPVRDLALRASYGTGFLPPVPNQLGPEPSALSTVPFTDPRRGGTGPVDAYTALVGGNANLRPEESRNWSAGIILTPRQLPGLRLSIDYSRFDKTDNIFQLSIQEIINNEGLFPERVTRGPRLPGDPADWAGPIIAVDDTLVNVSEAHIEAYDLQLAYRLDTAQVGSFEFFAVGTRQTHYETQVAPTTPVVENVGFRNQPPKFKGIAGITWNYRGWTVGWNVNHFDSYRVYGPTDSASRVALLSSTQGNDGRVKAQTYHDVHAGYHFSSNSSDTRLGNLLERLEIQVGAKNVLDTDPPVDILNNAGGYSLYADPRLATYYVSLIKGF